MGGGKNHEHNHEPVRGNRLLVATFLNLSIAAAEVIGGLLSNSLSLLSDALHNLSDALAVFLAWVAHRIARRPSNHRRTFGYKRIEILAALLNAVILILLTFYLFYEAIGRFLDPEPIKGLIMLVVAGIGLLANLAAVWILHRDSGKNINVRAAYLHLISDTLSSVAVIIGGIMIYFFDLYWIDPLITILIGLYILKETWGILRQANDILMQGTPPGLDLEKVRHDLEQIREIKNIHHVHTWSLDDQSVHFECHVDLRDDLRLSDVEKIHQTITSLLREKYNVAHITIQFEHKWCNDTNMIHS